MTMCIQNNIVSILIVQLFMVLSVYCDSPNSLKVLFSFSNTSFKL